MSDLEQASLTELIRLRNQLSEVLARRFERPLALVFTDIVGSTAYFARFGNEAGRALQQRHLDAVARVSAGHGGRVVDTAGDGAFCCFPSVEEAVAALAELQLGIASAEESLAEEHRLAVRTGVHHGPVLTDGTLVSGDAVNFCARVAGTGAAGEIRLTRAAFNELSGERRVRCRALAPAHLKGIAEPVPILLYQYADPRAFPVAVRVTESGQEHVLPSKNTISFGRLREKDGQSANDVVLSHPDVKAALEISRWHFELRRTASGMLLRALSDRSTEVDGVRAEKGRDVPVQVGTVVRVAGVLTLTFVGESLTRSAFTTGG